MFHRSLDVFFSISHVTTSILWSGWKLRLIEKCFFSWNEIIANLLSNEARVVHLIIFLLSDNEVNYGLLCFSKFIHSLVISVMSLTKLRPLLWRKLGVWSPCMTNTNVIPVAFGFDCISRSGITWGNTYRVVRTLHVVNHRGYGQFCCGFFTIRIRATHCFYWVFIIWRINKDTHPLSYLLSILT